MQSSRARTSARGRLRENVLREDVLRGHVRLNPALFARVKDVTAFEQGTMARIRLPADIVSRCR